VGWQIWAKQDICSQSDICSQMLCLSSNLLVILFSQLTNLYGLCLYVESFSKHFEKYGAIVDSVIMKDKHTKMPRGFGFVTFSDPSVIDKVLEDEHVIDGRMVGHLNLDRL
jgi:hypothetical protein